LPYTELYQAKPPAVNGCTKFEKRVTLANRAGIKQPQPFILQFQIYMRRRSRAVLCCGEERKLRRSRAILRFHDEVTGSKRREMEAFVFLHHIKFALNQHQVYAPHREGLMRYRLTMNAPHIDSAGLPPRGLAGSAQQGPALRHRASGQPAIGLSARRITALEHALVPRW
jgi:hypothetical protein